MTGLPLVPEIPPNDKITAKVGAFFRKVFFFKKKDEKSRSDRLKHWIIKVFSIIVWTYSIVTIFFINIDAKFVAIVGSPFDLIIQFKAVFILILFALSWLALGSRDLFFSLIYIAIYPIKILAELALISALIVLKFRSWIIVFAIMNAVVEFILRIKSNFITMTIFAVCLLLILVSEQPYVLVISTAAMIGLVLFSYTIGTWRALAPSSVFKIIRAFPKKGDDSRYKSFELEDELKDKSLIQMDDEQLTKWNNKLQTSVLYNRGMLFYAKTLRDYRRSRLPFLPSLFTVFRLLTFTISGFSIANYGLFKAFPSSYNARAGLKPFYFVYYSFSATLWNSIDELKPIRPISQSVLMIQELLSFILVGILISLFISHQSQRASSDLDEAVQAAESEAARMENWIVAEYKINSISAAIDHLRQAEANMLKAIAWLSKGL